MLDDDDDTEEVETPEQKRWSWVTFCSLMVWSVARWLMLCGTCLTDVSKLMDGHDEWKRGQMVFERQASLEIEALVKAVESERPKIRRKART